MLRSFDDVSPITIRTNLKAPLHAEWSNSRKLLAIAGTKDSENGQGSPHEYANLLKFYSVTGTLVYTAAIPYTQVSRTQPLFPDQLSELRQFQPFQKSPLTADFPSSRITVIVDIVVDTVYSSGEIWFKKEICSIDGWYRCQCPVSALTWGHNDRRLFVATGARVHAAWVSR